MSFESNPPQEADEQRPFPLSHFLRGIPSHKAPGHPLEDYAKAFEESPYRVIGILDAGGESVVLELEDERVIKISQGKMFGDERGYREFDLPILDSGSFLIEGADFSVEGYYIIQQKVDMNVSDEDTKKFISMVERLGYEDIDIGYAGQKQLGYWRGRVYLVDYNAVKKRNLLR